MSSEAGEKNDNGTVVISNNVKKMRLKISSKKLAVISLAFILLTGSLLAIFWDSLPINKSAKVCSDRSEGSILNRMDAVFDMKDAAVQRQALSEVVTEVTKRKNYEKDANCLYPIIFQHISMSSGKKADEVYGKFATAYGDGEGFANDIYPFTDLESLRKHIDLIMEYETKTFPSGAGSISSPAINQGAYPQ
jgi:hypothetical protein